MLSSILPWLIAPAFAQVDPALVSALSARHGAPACADLDATSPALQEVITHVSVPPWVPMRAASCLIELHSDTSEAPFLMWVSDPSLKGLGRMLLRRLDTLPEALSLRIVDAGLQGELKEEVLTTASVDPRPSIQQRALEARGTP